MTTRRFTKFLGLAIGLMVYHGVARSCLAIEDCDVHVEGGNGGVWETSDDGVMENHQLNNYWFDVPAATCSVDDSNLDYQFELSGAALQSIMFAYRFEDSAHNVIAERTQADLASLRYHLSRGLSGTPAELPITLEEMTFEGFGGFSQSLVHATSSVFHLDRFETTNEPGVYAAIYRGGFDFVLRVIEPNLDLQPHVMSSMMPIPSELAFLTTLPEPSSLAMSVALIAALVGCRRRRLQGCVSLSRAGNG